MFVTHFIHGRELDSANVTVNAENDNVKIPVFYDIYIHVGQLEHTCAIDALAGK